MDPRLSTISDFDYNSFDLNSWNQWFIWKYEGKER